MSKGQWKGWSFGLVVLGAVVLLRPAVTVAQEDVNALKAELQAQKQRQAELEDKINQLEARQKLKERAMNEKIEQVTAAQAQAEEKKSEVIPESLKWASKLGLYGDLRYRYEYFDDDSATSDRNRNRIRARIGIDTKLSDEWNLGFRIATSEGEDQGDPVSTNQTLDGGFSKKPIWLDLAFFGYHPAWLKGLDLYAGKINFPFYRAGKNELIWDSDLTPEGGAIIYGTPLGDKTTANFVAGGFWVNEESSGPDTSLWGLQAYVKHSFDKPTYLIGGVSWYDYGNIQGAEGLATEWKNSPTSFFGNTRVDSNPDPNVTDYVFASNYNLLELFAEFGAEVAKLPVAVFGDWVMNTAAINDNQDTGWLVGGQVNKAKDPGSWQFGYDYREVELDAVVGQFTCSDFLSGGTGGKGHRFSFTYVVAKNVSAALTYWDGKYDGRNSDADVNRLQADFMLKF